jgi:fatty acid desaturase
VALSDIPPLETVPAASERTIPLALNLALASFHISANLVQFLLLPAVLLPKSSLWLLCLVPLALASNPFWSLIHEAIHGLFAPSRRLNRLMGRSMAIFFGSPFAVLQSSHLLHHQLNRTAAEAAEAYDPRRRSRAQAAALYYAQLCGGLYLAELAAVFVFWLPARWLARWRDRLEPDSLSAALFRRLLAPDTLREIRADALASCGLFAAAIAAYGAQWIWLFALLAARAFLISFFDNVYHYGTPLGRRLHARNLRLPRHLSRAFLHFNLHGVHHENPGLPWPELARVAGQRRVEGGFLKAALGQLAGPIALEKLARGG